MLSWLISTNHKNISALYYSFSLMFSLVGTFYSLKIYNSIKFTDSSNTSMSETLCLQESMSLFITAQGLMMIIFYMMPILMGNLMNLLPLLLGSSDMAFPRLNNLSFWLLPFSLCLLIISSFLVDLGVGSGWTLYPPLSSLVGHQGMGVDLGIFSMHIAGASSIGVSVNFLFTTLKDFSFDLNSSLMLIFSFFILLANLLGVMFYLEIYLTMMDMMLGSGGPGGSSGSSFNFNNPIQPGGQPPKGGPSGGSGFFSDKKLDELKENLINDKENIDKEKEMSSNKKDDSISSSDQSSNYGSKENLLKDKTNKKKKCNII